MKVLGLDTSALLASVAIVENGELLSELGQTSETGSRTGPPGTAKHSEAILPLIELALREQALGFSDLAALGVALGPGSYTGLRVGLSTAKGLAYGADMPVLGVRTLEALAHRVQSPGKEQFVCPFMDARKGQVYAALYHLRPGGAVLLMGDTLDTPEKVLEKVSAFTAAGCLFVGEGTRLYGDLIQVIMKGTALLTTGNGYPSTAAAVARIAERRLRNGESDPLDGLAPDYLRPPDAVPPKPKTA